MARVNAQVHGNFNGLVKLGVGLGLHQLYRVRQAIILGPVNVGFVLGNTLWGFAHLLTPQPEGPWTGQNLQFHVPPHQHRGHSCP